ncbi:MAG: NDP-sugar synthase [Candidatus Margulisbacteria bacterium]|nr:NDP-sugar synthase [Candidatus Margulisiibacteriota bacterium]
MRALLIDIGQKKDLRDILGRDILAHQLSWLRADKELEEIVIFSDWITQNYQKDNVAYYACRGLPKYGLLKKVLNDQPFLLLYGPVLSAFPLHNLREQFCALRADILCLTGGSFHGETYAVEQNTRQELLSPFGSGDAADNVYIINPLTLTYYFHERFDIQAFLTEMRKHRRQIYCLPNPDWIEYVNNYAAYYQATRRLLDSPELPGTKIHNSYYGGNCEIDFSVELRGRQFFGEDCRVGARGILSDSVFLDRTVIGADARISGSILQKNVKIGRSCELPNCLIGAGCVIGDKVRLSPGTVLAADSTVQSDSGVLNVF